MKRSSLRQVLYQGVLIWLLLTTLLVSGSLALIGRLNRDQEDTRRAQAIQLSVSQLQGLLWRGEAQARGFVSTGREELLQDYDQGQAARLELGNLKKLLASPAVPLTDVSEAMEEQIALSNRVVMMRQAGHEAESRLLLASEEGKEAREKLRRSLGQVDSSQAQGLEERLRTQLRTEQILVGLLGTGLVASLVAGGFFLSRVARRLGPLGEYGRFVRKVAEGDLSQTRLESRTPDEVGELASCLNAMADSLRGATLSIRNGADQLARAGSEILDAAGQQSEMISSQASGIQASSATLEDLQERMSELAGQASDGSLQSQIALKAAENGLQAVENRVRSTATVLDQVRALSERIQTLGEKTRHIGDMVSAVNEISERSHVLALNASILAYSGSAAGVTQSIGVIAHEIRSLADQSREATLHVPELLAQIEDELEASQAVAAQTVQMGLEGTRYTDLVQDTIQQLTQNVLQSSQAFEAMAEANRQQSQALQTFSLSQTSALEAIRETASNTQRLESSARELQSLCESLVASVRRFRLPE